jgi:hypothetical protein
VTAEALTPAVVGRSQRFFKGVERRSWLWPYGTLALLLAWAVWPAWTATRFLVSGGDVVLIHYPYFVLWRDSLVRGEFPFWNPYTFSGIPAFATLQAGFGYPPHWLLSWAPAIQAINWTVGIHVLLAGLGAAWCAERLGAPKSGQFLSGLAYALGSAMLARLWAGHLSFLEANAWLPVATGLVIQLRGPRTVVPLALVVGLLALAGQPEIVIFSLWWLPLWAGLTGAPGGPRQVLRALLLAGLGLVLGLGLAAFQLLPTAALLSVSNRQVGMGWDFLTGASLPPWHLLGLLHPLIFGGPRDGYWPGPGYEWHERLLYLGIVPLLAALRASGPWRWLCLGLAGVAVALAFGRYGPWYAVAVTLLPGYDSLRIPSKHLTLAALGLCLAAGLGASRLHGRRFALFTLAFAGLLSIASLTIQVWFPLLASLLGGTELLVTRNLPDRLTTYGVPALRQASLVAALVGLAALLPHRWALPVQLLLAVAELLLVLAPFRAIRDDPQSVLNGTESLHGYERVAVFGNGGALLANYGPVLTIEQPAGYVSLFSSGYAALVTGSPNPGVAFDVNNEALPVLRLLGYGVFYDRDTSQLTIIEPPPPRAWVARCRWPGNALSVRQPDFPRQVCITHPEATVQEQPRPPGAASVLARGAGWMVVEAEGPGWLVTVEPWYPGWEAWIDEHPATIQVVDGALVGVPLAAERQTVSLRYQPAGLELGVALSLGSATLLGALWWVTAARSRAARLAQPLTAPAVKPAT